MTDYATEKAARDIATRYTDPQQQIRELQRYMLTDTIKQEHGRPPVACWSLEDITTRDEARAVMLDIAQAIAEPKTREFLARRIGEFLISCASNATDWRAAELLHDIREEDAAPRTSAADDAMVRPGDFA